MRWFFVGLVGLNPDLDSIYWLALDGRRWELRSRMSRSTSRHIGTDALLDPIPKDRPNLGKARRGSRGQGIVRYLLPLPTLCPSDRKACPAGAAQKQVERRVSSGA